jgi:hypothetical protein
MNPLMVRVKLKQEGKFVHLEGSRILDCCKRQCDYLAVVFFKYYLKMLSFADIM